MNLIIIIIILIMDKDSIIDISTSKLFDCRMTPIFIHFLKNQKVSVPVKLLVQSITFILAFRLLSLAYTTYYHCCFFSLEHHSNENLNPLPIYTSEVRISDFLL